MSSMAGNILLFPKPLIDCPRTRGQLCFSLAMDHFHLFIFAGHKRPSALPSPREDAGFIIRALLSGLLTDGDLPAKL